ncbi:hypothetical protein BRD12_06465, partial [Halobacteriales archaeon SW_12_67_38]
MADRSDDADGAASRADAVDRLERVIDTQIDTVDDFDQKAAYVTRFVGVVLGLVLTAVSLASRFGGGDPATQLPAVAAVERNRQVLRVNAGRFRRALVALLVGIAYLAMAALLFALA